MGSISIDYAGYIPYDKHLHESVSRREPVTCCYPESSSSQSFKKLAEFLLDSDKWKTSMTEHIQFFWKRLMAGGTVE